MNNSEATLTKRQTNFTFAVVALAILMAGIDSTIVSVGLPALLTDLHTNLAMVAWTDQRNEPARTLSAGL